jgi:hypothetical protein
LEELADEKSALLLTLSTFSDSALTLFSPFSAWGEDTSLFKNSVALPPFNSFTVLLGNLVAGYAIAVLICG